MNQSISVADSFTQRSLWNDVLMQWLELLKRYESGSGDDFDVAYWHGERPLTGLLGAAAWMLQDGWSLEEFSTKRKFESYKIHGRGDLWFGRDKENSTVEAKIYWAGETIGTAKKYLLERLDEAAAQLRSLKKNNRNGDPVSVCFVVPWYDAPKGKTRGLETLAKLEKWAREESLTTAKHIAAANACITSKGSEYPGVLLVARQESWKLPTSTDID